MTQALPQLTSHQNVRVVRMEPDVKSAETRKLFNAGMSAKAKTGKSTDPTCYNSPTVKEKTGLFENQIRRIDMPNIGDVRFIVQMIDNDRYEKLARKRGWDGTEGMMDYCEPEEAAIYSEHKMLEEATASANAWLAKGKSTFGCCMIDRQVFERFDDGMYPDWENKEQYEVAMDGECIKVAG